MKSNPFITCIMDESEVEHQVITLEEITRIFRSTHLRSFIDPFMDELK